MPGSRGSDKGRGDGVGDRGESDESRSLGSSGSSVEKLVRGDTLIVITSALRKPIIQVAENTSRAFLLLE